MTAAVKPAPLGFASLMAMVVASMVGAGLYTTSGYALGDLGDPWWVLVAWAIGGGIAICGAVGYSLLAEQLTENGGEYLYLSRNVHPVAGSIAGWISFFAGFSGAAAFAATAFESYLASSSNGTNQWPSGSIAISLVAVLTVLHCFNTSRGATSQTIAVVIKLLLLIGFGLYCYACIDRWSANLLQFGSIAASFPGWFPMATTVMWISLSYSGFNAAVYVADEVRGGSLTIGRSMVAATVAVTVLYLLLNAIFLLAPPAELIVFQENVATIAADSVSGSQDGGSWLATVVRTAICLGLATSVSAILMAGPRVYAKMAADGVFPRFFNSKRPPPRRAVILQGVAISGLIAATSIRELLDYLGLTLSVSAAASVATLFWSRPIVSPDDGISTANMQRLDYRYGLSMIFVVATLIVAAVSAWNRPQGLLAFLATITIGIVMYALTKRGSGSSG